MVEIKICEVSKLDRAAARCRFAFDFWVVKVKGSVDVVEDLASCCSSSYQWYIMCNRASTGGTRHIGW